MDKGATLHGCTLNCTILTRSFSAVLNTSYPDKALHYCLHLCALCILYTVPARSVRSVLLSAPCTQPRVPLYRVSASASQLQPAVQPDTQLSQLQADGSSPASCTYPHDFLFAYFTFATLVYFMRLFVAGHARHLCGFHLGIHKRDIPAIHCSLLWRAKRGSGWWEMKTAQKLFSDGSSQGFRIGGAWRRTSSSLL